VQPEVSVARIRAALDDVLGWPEMARSPQLAQFLRYIVDARLDGREAAIKAYSIAVDVFGRPPDFDPQSDPIVRVQARRLRTLLDQYYEDGRMPHGVRIRLPVGRYVPEFEVLAEGEDAPALAPVPLLETPPPVAISPEPTNWRFRSGVLIGAFFASALAGLAYMIVVVGQPLPPGLDSPPPQEPQVTVVDFQNLAGDEGNAVAGDLALALVSDLGHFDDIETKYGVPEAPRAQSPQENPSSPDLYVLSGITRVVDDAVEYGAILTRSQDQSVQWSYAVSRPMAEASQPRAVDEVSRRMALVLGSPRGPLHQQARRWLALHPNFAAAATPYICRVALEVYHDSGRPADGMAARNCIAALPADEKIAPAALAASAALTMDMAPPEAVADQAENANRLTDAALAAAPISSFVWEQSGRVEEVEGDLAKARMAYSSAVQLNPASANALAALGRLLALGPDWQQGAQIAQTAITETPSPPAWYFAAPALNALRGRDYDQARKFGETLAQSDRTLGSVIVVTAALESGQTDVVSRYLPQVLDHQPFRAHGILPELGRRLSDSSLLASLAGGLERAGVPPKALTGPY